MILDAIPSSAQVGQASFCMDSHRPTACNVQVTICNCGSTVLFNLHGFLVAWGSATCMQDSCRMLRDCYLLSAQPLPHLAARRL